MHIEIQTTVNTSAAILWDYWTKAEHIVNWNFASDDWCCPRATNELKEKGKFNYRMESKDKKMGFDFEGVYTQIITHKLISYKLEDDRKVNISFEENNGQTTLTEGFDAEDENSAEMQRQGWQAILNNFKSYVERSQA